MKDILIPDVIATALSRGAAIVLSVSGGKDGDAMVWAITRAIEKHGWKGAVHLVHADLGRAEWKETPEYVERLSKRSGYPLSVVRHTYGDLIDGIRRRMETRPDAPPFPSAAARFCTSDWKRSPISKWIRNTFPAGEVVCAMGLRAQESPARARKPVYDLRADCWKMPVKAGKNRAADPGRQVWNWNPIHDWKLEDVWEAINQGGNGGHHPAYDVGNERLSCSLCILASLNDLMNGAEHNPEAYRELCRLEMESGFSFRQKMWLCSLRPDLLDADVLAWWMAKNTAAAYRWNDLSTEQLISGDHR